MSADRNLPDASSLDKQSEALARDALAPYRALIDSEGHPLGPVVRAVLEQYGESLEAARVLDEIVAGWTASALCHVQDLERVEDNRRALRTWLRAMQVYYPRVLRDDRARELARAGFDPSDLPEGAVRWEAAREARERLLEVVFADLPGSLEEDGPLRTALNEAATRAVAGKRPKSTEEGQPRQETMEPSDLAFLALDVRTEREIAEFLEEAREAAARALADLRPADERAWVLSYYEGMTRSEIAEAEGVQLQTVSNRLSRARAGMREALDRLEAAG